MFWLILGIIASFIGFLGAAIKSDGTLAISFLFGAAWAGIALYHNRQVKHLEAQNERLLIQLREEMNKEGGA